MDRKQPFYLRSVNPDDLLTYQNRNKADILIEVVPYNRPQFDFISFIEFANTIYDDYYFSNIYKHKEGAYMELYKKHFKIPTFHETLFQFKIILGNNFDFIRIYVKYYMNDFDYIEKKGFYCIKLSNDHIFNPFEKVIISKTGEPTFIDEIAKYYLSGKHSCPEIIKTFFCNQINKKPQNILNSFNSVEETLKFCPGSIKVCYLQKKEYTNLKTISIIFPWYDMIENFQYIELDGSFKASKPYVFCIGQGIIHNESIPFSLTIAPTESALLYDMIFQHIKEISLGKIDFTGKTILSDMGLALKSISEKWQLNQFLCHRHIIEHFGSSGVLGILCARLLKCYSFEKYDQIRIEIQFLLNAYVDEKKKQNTYSKECQQKVEDLNTMLKGDQGDPNSNYFIYRWALWIRRGYSVARCSNHNESLHGAINKTLMNGGDFNSKLSNLILQTLAHCENLKFRKGKTIKRKLKKTIKNILLKLQSPTYDILKLCKEKCNCQETEYNESIYGTKIPCIHQILFPAKQIIEIIIKKIENNTDGITINILITSILSYRFFLKQLNDDASKVAHNYFHFLDISLPKEDLIMLADAIQKCFIFPFPEIPDVQITWDKNDMKIDTVNNFNCPIDNDFSKKAFIPSFDDIDFDFIEFNIKRDDFAKRLLAETGTEITRVYPEIRTFESAIDICYDAFEKFLMYGKDKRTIDAIVEFKIACWKKADQLTKKNRFFR